MSSWDDLRQSFHRWGDKINAAVDDIADQTAVPYLNAGLCQCAGLVDTLAAKKHIAAAGSLGFAGENDVIHGVNIVDV